jgi:hypothetical protein
MKQRLLLALIALMGLTAMAQTTNYGIKIGGVEVTPGNYTNISATGDFSAVKSGTVTYDPSTHTLTLANANIVYNGGTSAINFYQDDYSIITDDYNLVLAEGTLNMVTAGSSPALETTMPLTIKGGGTAVFKSDSHCGIYGCYNMASHDYTLSIENSTVAAMGKWGITAENWGTLNIVNSTVIGTGWMGSVCDFKTLTATGVELASPSGAAWVDGYNAVCMGDEVVMSTVTFKPKSSSGSGGTGSGRAGDMNGDGLLTISDVTALVDVILNSSSDFGTHEYVDLGLPSGTLWATTNVGATTPEDYGGYFAWGETVSRGEEDKSNLSNYQYADTYVKTYYSSYTYKWGTFEDGLLTKYCDNSEYGYKGYTDALTELELSDDAAYVNWGPGWRTPTKEQLEELVDPANTKMECITVNGVLGRKITSIRPGYEGNSIFLPFAGGAREDEDPASTGLGMVGVYWSRTLLQEADPNYSHCLYILSDEAVEEAGEQSTMVMYNYRVFGFSVRPVRAQ